MENGVFNYGLFHVERKKFGQLIFTSNKVLLPHFEPPKFNIALAIHVYDNAIAFRPHYSVANRISTPNCPRSWT